MLFRRSIWNSQRSYAFPGLGLVLPSTTHCKPPFVSSRTLFPKDVSKGARNSRFSIPERKRKNLADLSEAAALVSPLSHRYPADRFHLGLHLSAAP